MASGYDTAMRIALISPLYEAVPPIAYGGTERVIASLADELVRRGHEVTLFAAEGSRTAATLVACSRAPLRYSMSRTELEQLAPHLHLKMLADVHRRADAGEFDIVHAHTDIWTLPFARPGRVPTVVTMHGRLDLDVVRTVLPMYPDMPLVSISDHQRGPVEDLPVRWTATCPNGLDLSAYFAASRCTNGEYLAFVGRITPEKRPDWAVEVAARSGRKLRVAAKVDAVDVDYWDAVIEPLFRKHDVEFVGEIGEADKPSFFAQAAATLFPIDWPEPFGLVMIESLATGTPVIALRNGSVPEILTDGKSGFICDSIDDMVSSVGHLGQLRESACRDEARRFTAATMTDRYLDIYDELIDDLASVTACTPPLFAFSPRSGDGGGTPHAARAVAGFQQHNRKPLGAKAM
jgi:glycosyltransferase involved in cell wall biosynthesis